MQGITSCTVGKSRPKCVCMLHLPPQWAMFIQELGWHLSESTAM